MVLSTCYNQEPWKQLQTVRMELLDNLGILYEQQPHRMHLGNPTHNKRRTPKFMQSFKSHYGKHKQQLIYEKWYLICYTYVRFMARNRKMCWRQWFCKFKRKGLLSKMSHNFYTLAYLCHGSFNDELSMVQQLKKWNLKYELAALLWPYDTFTNRPRHATHKYINTIVKPLNF